MIESSISTSTRPVSIPDTSGVFSARLLRNREATAPVLPDVPEGEFSEERSQRRRCIGSVENGSHRPVPQDRQVGDAVGAGDHPTDQGPDLTACIGSFVGRHAQVLVGKREQAAGLRQRHHRDQARGRHEVGIVEPRRRDGSSVR